MKTKFRPLNYLGFGYYYDYQNGTYHSEYGTFKTFNDLKLALLPRRVIEVLESYNELFYTYYLDGNTIYKCLSGEIHKGGGRTPVKVITFDFENDEIICLTSLLNRFTNNSKIRGSSRNPVFRLSTFRFSESRDDL